MLNWRCEVQLCHTGALDCCDCVEAPDLRVVRVIGASSVRTAPIPRLHIYILSEFAARGSSSELGGPGSRTSTVQY